MLLVFIRVVLAIVFAWAGIAKVLDPAGSKKAVFDLGLPRRVAGVAAAALPIAELVTAFLLLWTRTVLWGAVAALILLVAFALVISANLLKGRTPECHCFGQFHSRPISWMLVARNAVLAGCATAVLCWDGSKVSIGAAARRLMEIAAVEPVPFAAVLIAAGGFAIGAFILLALFEQHGRLMLRMDKFERHAAGAALAAPTPPTVAGLRIGERAPSFELSAAGRPLPFQALLSRGRPILIVFTDPDCQPCQELMPDLSKWERQYEEIVTLVVVNPDTSSANGGPKAEWAFQNTALQRKHEISQLYKVGGTPAAVVIRLDGTVGSLLAFGPAAVRSLVMFLLYSQTLASVTEIAV